jgi:hypothetical protein
MALDPLIIHPRPVQAAIDQQKTLMILLDIGMATADGVGRIGIQNDIVAWMSSNTDIRGKMKKFIALIIRIQDQVRHGYIPFEKTTLEVVSKLLSGL